MNIEIDVPMKPQAWKRPQFNNKQGYTDSEVATYERTVATYAKMAMAGKEPTKEGCAVCVSFHYEYLKEHKKKDGLLIDKYTRPDVDNLLKAVLDAMNGIVYVDDGQVNLTIATKKYAPQNGVHITVTTSKTEEEKK
jgi:Holliday junction resolvase RusA-like endonuclease